VVDAGVRWDERGQGVQGGRRALGSWVRQSVRTGAWESWPIGTSSCQRIAQRSGVLVRALVRNASSHAPQPTLSRRLLTRRCPRSLLTHSDRPRVMGSAPTSVHAAFQHTRLA
jgi:hypothetical protein